MSRNDHQRGDVLIVDDDERVFEMVRHYFTAHWRVHAAYNSWQALDAVAGLSEIKLALVDLNLPGSDYTDRDHPRGGFEVIQRMKQRFPLALVVVFTGYINTWTVNASARLGAEILGKEDFDTNFGLLAQRLLALEHTDASTAKAITAFARANQLTDRQVEIIALATRHFDRAAMAVRLEISLDTVKKHIANILRQCDAISIKQIRTQLLGAPEAGERS